MSKLRTLVGYLSIAGAFVLSAPAVAMHPAASPNLGTPIHSGSADRAVILTDDKKSVSVDGGETIKFVVNGQSFLWKFDTFNSIKFSFDFDRIAPQSVAPDRPIRVYVAPDPSVISG